MRIVFMGTIQIFLFNLKNLIKHYEVILVVTQPDKPLVEKSFNSFSS